MFVDILILLWYIIVLIFLVIVYVLSIGFVFGAFLYIVSSLTSMFFDAPLLPSSKKAREKMMEFAGDIDGKNVIDLGCGYGHLVFAAAEKGANSSGVEISTLVFLYANLFKFLFKKKGLIKRNNLFNEDLSNADVIFCYLCTGAMDKLDKKIKAECKKGCVIVSNSFKLSGWEFEDSYDSNPRGKIGFIYKYVVKHDASN